MRKITRNKKVTMAIAVAAMVMSLAGCGVKPQLANDVYQVELGTEISANAADYLVFDENVSAEEQAEILAEVTLDVSNVDTNTIGEYEASATYKNTTYDFTVQVADTTAPTATLANEVLETEVGAEVKAADLVTGIEDAQDVTVQFVTSSVAPVEAETTEDGTEAVDSEEAAEETEAVEETEENADVSAETDETAAVTEEAAEEADTENTDAEATEEVVEGTADSVEATVGEELGDVYTFDTEGDYTITIRLTDASGNVTDLTQNVHVVVPDTTAPEITGMKDMTVYVGNTPDYVKGVVATDDVDGDLTDKIEIDSSAVNVEKAGSYTVKYTCTDAAGNTAEEEITITVKNKVQQTTTTTTNAAGNETTAQTGGSSDSGSSGGSSSGGSSSGGSSSSGSSSSGGSSSGSASSGGSSSGSSDSVYHSRAFETSENDVMQSKALIAKKWRRGLVSARAGAERLCIGKRATLNIDIVLICGGRVLCEGSGSLARAEGKSRGGISCARFHSVWDLMFAKQRADFIALFL